MVKPVDSASPNRPISVSHQGREVMVKAKLVTAGHVSSVLQIGPVQVRIGNAAIREAVGDADL